MVEDVKFEPKISFNKLKALERSLLQAPVIKNDETHYLAEKLTGMAEPNLVYSEYDRRWINFYLPVKKKEKLICIPFAIINYREKFLIHSKEFKFDVIPGNQECDEIYKDIFKETIRFLPIIKENSSILEKLVPYKYREGKIKGKYVMENLLPKEVAKELLRKYYEHIRKKLVADKISLNEYLKVAGICYRAIFPEESGLSDLELYKKHADFRHGGILDIKDWNSEEEFKKWYLSDSWIGSSPFEILYTFFEEGGIVLLPPVKNPYYIICLENKFMGKDLIKAVEALIAHEVSFRAIRLREIINYLQGESYLQVNGNYPEVYYYSKKDKIFKYVKWKPLELPKLK
jgi:hypothetical protein